MQEKSQIKKRILLYIDNQGITKQQFYKETGITRGVLDQNNGMSETNIARFLAKYQEVSATWLLTGNGQMTTSVCPEVSDFNELERENKRLYQINDTLIQTLNQMNEVVNGLREENKSLHRELELLKKDFPNHDECSHEREYHEQTSLSTCISSTPMTSDTTKSKQLV
jgi:hypothetical protein